MSRHTNPRQPERGTDAAPRKRAPGAGRPAMGRTANLPRIRPEAHARLIAIADGHGIAATLERLIAAAPR